VSATPASGRGWNHPLTVRFTDPNGYTNIRYVHTLTNAGLNGIGACYTYYLRIANELYLMNDNHTSWLLLGPNAGDSVSNSQCTLYRSGTSVSAGGNDLTFTLNLQYKASFGGVRDVYGYVVDNGWVANNWQWLGTWDVGEPYVGQYAPAVNIDSPGPGAAVWGVVNIAGWAIDAANAPETAISSVEVFIDGIKVGNATYGGSRPDVCVAFPGRPGCPNVGYSFAWNTAGYSFGNHTIRVVATDSDTPTRRTAFMDQVVTISSPVQISVSPASTTMNCMESRSFTAAVTGTGNPAVTWSIANPVMATLTSTTSNPTTAVGYQPGCTQTTRTTNLTARSVADTSKTASAAITMYGSASPMSVTLSPGNQQAFFPPWQISSYNLSPNLGSVYAPPGVWHAVYTAPPSSSGGQKVTLTLWNFSGTPVQSVITLP
jgi:hypothetical protein